MNAALLKFKLMDKSQKLFKKLSVSDSIHEFRFLKDIIDDQIQRYIVPSEMLDPDMYISWNLFKHGEKSCLNVIKACDLSSEGFSVNKSLEENIIIAEKLYHDKKIKPGQDNNPIHELWCDYVFYFKSLPSDR